MSSTQDSGHQTLQRINREVDQLVHSHAFTLPELESLLQDFRSSEEVDVCSIEKWPTNSQLVQLAGALRSNTKLKSIIIQDWELTDGFVCCIGEILHHNGTLRVLELTNVYITDVGACALARGLEHNTTLSELYLGHNDIELKGGKALAKALLTNTSLRVCSVYSNGLTGEGVQSILKAVEHNSTLQELDLAQCCNFDVPTAESLAAALRANSTLADLSLWGNVITNEHARIFLPALKDNRTMVAFNLAQNPLVDSDDDVDGNGGDENGSITASIRAVLQRNNNC